MAEFSFQMPQELFQKLTRLEDKNYIQNACHDALKKGGEILKNETKRQLQRVIGTMPMSERDKRYGSRSTGELVRSLGVSPVGVTSYGKDKGSFNVKVGFNEPRSSAETQARESSRLYEMPTGERFIVPTNDKLTRLAMKMINAKKVPPNAKIANILEYGRHGKIARPFMKPAMKKCKKEVEAVMQSVIEEAIENA